MYPFLWSFFPKLDVEVAKGLRNAGDASDIKSKAEECKVGHLRVVILPLKTLKHQHLVIPLRIPK